MIGSHTTSDGFVIEVYDTIYMSYGIRICYEDEELYYNPSSLCCMSYGSSACEPCAELDDHDSCESRVAWTETDWAESLSYEADDLIEAYVPQELLDSIEQSANN